MSWTKYTSLGDVKIGHLVRLERDAGQTGGVFAVERGTGQVRFGPSADRCTAVFFTELLHLEQKAEPVKVEEVEMPTIEVIPDPPAPIHTAATRKVSRAEIEGRYPAPTAAAWEPDPFAVPKKR